MQGLMRQDMQSTQRICTEKRLFQGGGMEGLVTKTHTQSLVAQDNSQDHTETRSTELSKHRRKSPRNTRHGACTLYLYKALWRRRHGSEQSSAVQCDGGTSRTVRYGVVGCTGIAVQW